MDKPVLYTNGEITEDNSSADDDESEQDVKQGLNNTQADEQLSRLSQADEQTANPTLSAFSSDRNQLSITSQAETETNVQTLPAVKSVICQLSSNCKVNLLKMSAEPWSSFRSICVKEKEEDEDADWVLGGLQLEGSSLVGLDEEVGVGESVVAWDKEDQMFYRVVVARKHHIGEGLNYGTLSIDFGKDEIYCFA